MGRRIIYRIEDRSGNALADKEWDELQRLQHWYNSEFSWTAGRLAFKRYIIFPNIEEFGDLDASIWEIIAKRHQSLAAQGLSEYEVISQLERDKLLVVKWGGYYDDCLASGFTRVADNEWNAYLVSDFLLKASTLCPKATIKVTDEGLFVKTRDVWFRDGSVLLPRSVIAKDLDLEDMLQSKRIFSIVDAEKYDKHPEFKNIIPEFNKLKMKERKELVRNWNWLGYGDGYDFNGDDVKGFDLNAKVRRFEILD